MIQVLHCSEKGGGRENEDAWVVRPHPADPGCLLGAVADGQGGRAGGGPAARLACQTWADAVGSQPVASLLDPRTWHRLWRQIDQAVADDPEAGFTTLVAFLVTEGRLVGASAGDSAVTVACAGRPTVVPTDRQWKDPPVGSGEAVPVPFAVELVRPWTVLAMTDGVWKYAGWDRVKRCVETLPGEAILDELRRAVRLRSGAFPDDFTLVVLQAGSAGRAGPTTIANPS